MNTRAFEQRVERERNQQRADRLNNLRDSVVDYLDRNGQAERAEQIFAEHIERANLLEIERLEVEAHHAAEIAVEQEIQQVPFLGLNWLRMRAPQQERHPSLGYEKRPKGQKQKAYYQANAIFEAFDDDGNYHCETGPALIIEQRHPALGQYQSKYWYWHGLTADQEIILRPDRITVESIIFKASMPDYARAAIERYVGADPNDGHDGYKRFVRDYRGSEILDTDERFGTLMKAEIGHDEPIVVCVVTNRTKEEDGTFKKHWLRVPPHITTARAACAWTFYDTADNYNPVFET